MESMTVPIIGQCRACGAELGTELHVRSTAEWVARYNADLRLRNRMDRAMVRLIVSRHERHCPGRRPAPSGRVTA